VRSEVSIPDDARELGVEFIRVAGRKALARLSIDGMPAGAGEIPWMMGTISSVGASVGRDMGSPVSREYTDDFPYGGRLREVEIQLLSRQDAESLEAEMRSEMSRQ
jgi:arylsulfatase